MSPLWLFDSGCFAWQAIGKETGVAVETAELDLASFASIKSCAAALVEKHPRLDSLILNAGASAPFARACLPVLVVLAAACALV